MLDLDKVKNFSHNKKRSRLITLFFTHAIILAFLSLSRLIFFISFYEPSDYSDILQSFSLGLLFDFRATVIILLPTTLQVFIPYVPTKQGIYPKIFLILQSIFILFYLSVIAFDLGHYHYLKWRINSSIIDVLDNPDVSAGMILETYPVLSSLIAFLVFTTVLMYFIEWFKRNYFYKAQYGLVFFPYHWERSLWVIIILPLLYGKFSYFPLRWSDAFRSTNNFTNQMTLNPLMSFLESIDKKKESYDREKVKTHSAVLAEFLSLPEENVKNLNLTRKFQSEVTTQPPHIIFVQMESLAYDKTSFSNNPVNPTPFLKKIAQNEGVYFPHFYTPTEATARGVFAAITGIPDVTHDKSSSRNPLTSNHDLLFNQLPLHKKFYFLGGSANWGNIRGLWTSNISDIKIYEEGDWKSPRVDVWGISDLNLFKESLDIMDKAAKENHPVLGYVQTAGFHRPYTIPEDNDGFEKKSKYSLEDIQKHGFLSLEEFNSMRFQDHAFNRFWELLKQTSLYPNVIVVIYGDHGLPSEKSLHIPQGHYKHRVVNHHVPLIILAPMRAEPAVKDQIVGSLIDVVPTVFHLAQLPYETNTLGRNLFQEQPPSINAAFLFSFHEKPKHISIIDHEFLWIDTPTQKGLYRYNEELNFKSDVAKDFPDVAKKYEDLSNGIFEVSKYLLYNNKKK